MVHPMLFAGRLLALSTAVLAWEHVTGEELRASLENNDASLVACELRRTLIYVTQLINNHSCICMLLPTTSALVITHPFA